MAIPNSRQNQCPAKTGPAQSSFFDGRETRGYGYFGALLSEEGVTFRLWAPRAERVFLCGDFNGWSVTSHPMRQGDGGIWEAFLPASQGKEGQRYKYFAEREGRRFFKADPYGVQMQTPPESASVICDLRRYRWRDEGWLNYRREHFSCGGTGRYPVNIYKVHPATWGQGRPASYGALREELISYVKQMGYTHVELTPIAEHRADGAPGVEIDGFFAPTSRYGSPQELMSLIDGFHEAGVGVILDWVPAHFTEEEHGLCALDGAPLYEAEGTFDPDGSRKRGGQFDLHRGEVRSFLLSNAFYWIREFHADGLRICLAEGERDPLTESFLEELDCRVAEEFPEVAAFSARFLRGRGTQGEEMSSPADPEAVTADSRATLAALRAEWVYGLTLPGAKQTPMGAELGELRLQNGLTSPRWALPEQEIHARFQMFVAERNALYLRCFPLWEGEGEAFLPLATEEGSLRACFRRAPGGESVVVAINPRPTPQEDVLLSLPEEGVYREIFNSDEARYGGEGRLDPTPLRTSPHPNGGHALRITVPAWGGLILLHGFRREE